MSSLTYTHRDIPALEAADAKPARKPFWGRLVAAIAKSQQRRAEREIARYIATRGPLTDEVEREIMRRLSGAKPL
jgi:precorrin-6x reductase